MKRTRSGCHTCRQRRVKCDEGRPVCNNCRRRSLQCTYKMHYRWVRQMFSYKNVSPGEASPGDNSVVEEDEVQDAESPALGTKNPSSNRSVKNKGRKGPTSMRRKIGQEVVSRVEMGKEALNNLQTVMEEVPLDIDDAILELPQSSQHGDLSMFKKFVIRAKDDAGKPLHIKTEESEISAHLPYIETFGVQDEAATGVTENRNEEEQKNAIERATNPILLHSPLFRSYTLSNQLASGLEMQSGPSGGAQPRLVSSNEILTQSVVPRRAVSTPEMSELTSTVDSIPAVTTNDTSANPDIPPSMSLIPTPRSDIGVEPFDIMLGDNVGTRLPSPLLDPVYGPNSYHRIESNSQENPAIIFSKTLKRTNNLSAGLKFEIPPLEMEALEEALEAPLITSLDSHVGGISAFHQRFGFLAGITEQDLFDYFVNVVADDLVPIPFEESPFYKHLPLKAAHDKFTWDLLVAFAAAHRAVKFSNSKSGEMHPADFSLVEKLVHRCECNFELALLASPHSNKSLLGATLLAMIELDRGLVKRWWTYLDIALHIIRLRSSFAEWELNNEINSMLFRLVGFMTSMANLLCGQAPKLLAFPSWPQWSGSLDHLTGVDLNLLPLFSEVAMLSRSVRKLILTVLTPAETDRFVSRMSVVYPGDEQKRHHMRMLLQKVICESPMMQHLRMRALRVFQRMNDYWIEEYIPDSDITAMCILFQEALQIHILRRVLMMPADNIVVQRLVTQGMYHLETYIAPQSRIQRNMSFILATLASESLDLRHRTVLLIRMRNMSDAGFKHYWMLCRELKQHWDANLSLICSPTYTLLPR